MATLIQFRKPKRGWRCNVLFFVLTLLPWVLLLWLLWPTREAVFSEVEEYHIRTLRVDTTGHLCCSEHEFDRNVNFLATKSN